MSSKSPTLKNTNGFQSDYFISIYFVYQMKLNPLLPDTIDYVYGFDYWSDIYRKSLIQATNIFPTHLIAVDNSANLGNCIAVFIKRYTSDH